MKEKIKTMNNLNELVKKRRHAFARYSPSMLVIGDAGSGKTHIQKQEINYVLSHTNDRVVLLTTNPEEYTDFVGRKHFRILGPQNHLSWETSKKEENHILSEAFRTIYSILDERLLQSYEDILWIYIDCTDIYENTLLAEAINSLLRKSRKVRVCLTVSMYPEDVIRESIFNFQFYMLFYTHASCNKRLKSIISKYVCLDINDRELSNLGIGEGILLLDQDEMVLEFNEKGIIKKKGILKRNPSIKGDSYTVERVTRHKSYTAPIILTAILGLGGMLYFIKRNNNGDLK